MLTVIDGLDGSGKSTQFERLLAAHSGLYGISFPEYDKPSAALVKMYLNGEFSENASDVNAYAASTFYAADRYASYKLYWEQKYLSGEDILASRYVSSNIIHQMPKLPENEWDDFIGWIDDYEFGKLGLPRPDKVLLLDIPVEVSHKRLMMRYAGDGGHMDIHENNTGYMELCRRAALYAAEKCGWAVISCVDGNRELTESEIFAKLDSEIKGC
ncbi:MAG: thymidylate kinase [Oscillospiraceae bacterium]|nr:thymidylate kinase [Oscillospiraceae bacterium]